jgi:hypothetical protein
MAGPGRETHIGRVISIVLSLVSISALSICLCKTPPNRFQASLSISLPKTSPTVRRVTNVRDWTRLPLVCWREYLSPPCFTRIITNPKSRSCYLRRLNHIRSRHGGVVKWLWCGLLATDVCECHFAVLGVLYDNEGILHPSSGIV